ncbi:MAG: type III pantothenate kinase [Candidatus Cloacimonadia bacterium]
MRNQYLVIDIGNTNIEIGVYSQAGIVCSWRINTNLNQSKDEYYATLDSLAKSSNINLQLTKLTAIASVVPDLSRIFNNLLRRHLNTEIINVSANTPLGLTFPAKDPSFIGADLVVNAYSALHKYRTNVIICDFGTATTIQLIGNEGRFYGTVIAPGIIISSESLFNKASLLKSIQLETPKHTLGTNTKDSLLSGIITGHCLMVDSFIRRIKAEHSELSNIQAVATGGISTLLEKSLTEIDHFDKKLTLDGLYLICKSHLQK